MELSTPAATENVRLKVQETLEKHFADARNSHQFIATMSPSCAPRIVSPRVSQINQTVTANYSSQPPPRVKLCVPNS